MLAKYDYGEVAEGPEISGKLQALRPLQSVMKHGDQFQTFVPNPIRNDVRRIWHDKLACSEDSARPTRFRLGFQKVNRSENAFGDECGALLRFFLDVLSQGY